MQNSKNDFQKYHDSFRPLGRGRVFFRSGNFIAQNDGALVRARTYVKPIVEGEVKGKWQRKAAKRARQRASANWKGARAMS